MTPDSSRDATPPPLDDFAAGVLAALQRSAQRARRIAAQTGTNIVVVRDGELVVEPVTDPDPQDQGNE